MNEQASVETAKIDRTRTRHPESGATPSPAQRLDRYELRRLLGKGGFATVHEAYDPRIKRSVAIKRCSSLDQRNHERFFREAEIAGNLSHPNIVRIFDFGVADGTPFIVQELLGGRDLAHWIDSGLALSNHDRVRILLEIAKGLAYAHSRDVIHRDVKPSNVRVLEDGSIKLLDFGVAAIQEVSSSLTEAGVTVGTAAYLAPEQIRGERPDRATDVFSFGVLAYELLAGHRPFEGETLSAVLYQIAHDRPAALPPGTVPGPLTRLVHRCLEKQKEQRPSGFEEITKELEEALRDSRLRPPSADTVPIPTLPAGPASSSGRPERPGSAGPVAPTAPRTAPGLEDLPLGGLAQPPLDSTSRIQIARPRRRARLVLSILAAGLAVASVHAYFRGSLPEPASDAIDEAGIWLDRRLATRAGIHGNVEPAAASIRAGVARAARVESAPGEMPPKTPTQVVEAPSDPVTAAVAEIEAKRSQNKRTPETKVQRPPVSGTARATVFLPPGWHPRMMVAVDGGAFQALDRRHTLQLRPGTHKLTFRLETATYKTLETVEVQLEPTETRTIESPLAPPAILSAAAMPGTVDGRIEIDGRSVALPFREPQVLEPGSHRITLYPRPADTLGPLTKIVDLRSATDYLLTFDLRRRRALLEVRGAFEWEGS